MKKLVLAAVSAAFVGGLTIAAPANAQYLGGASANDYNRYQEAADPGYDLYHTRERYYGYNIYSNGYGYGFYFDENSVRRNTWRRGGKWYKNCGNDPAVPVEQPCYDNRVSYPVGYGPSTPQASYASAAPAPGTSTSEMVGGCLVTVTTDAAGKKSATSRCN
jgi:hypothetical protein